MDNIKYASSFYSGTIFFGMYRVKLLQMSGFKRRRRIFEHSGEKQLPYGLH